MKTFRLNETKQQVESVELNETKFQVWQKSHAIMQFRDGRVFWISNGYNFRWATNFISLDEAKRVAALWLETRPDYQAGLRIRSGNLVYSIWDNGQWTDYSTPKKMLL